MNVTVLRESNEKRNNTPNPKLRPINPDEFIQKVDAKPVTSDKTFENKKERKLDPKGVYSEEIFGLIGSQKRFEKFGYIELPFRVMAPFTTDRISAGILKTFFGKAYSNIIIGEPFYLLNDGSFSNEPEDKKRNLYSIYEFKTLDEFYNFMKEGEKNHEFEIFKNYWYEIKKTGRLFDKIRENLDSYFVNKIIVVPAGYRDILIKKDGTVVEDPLSKEYQELIRTVNYYLNNFKKQEQDTKENKKEENNFLDISPEDAFSQIGAVANELINKENKEETSKNKNKIIDYKTAVKKIYSHLNNIVNHIADILGIGGTNSKYKLIQGGKLAKRLDHAIRLVLEPDKNLHLDEISIPWMFLIKLYEPFVLHYIEKDPRFQNVKEWVLKEIVSIGETTEEFEQLQKIKTIPKEKFLKLANMIVTNPKIVPPDVKESFIQILQEIIDGKKDNIKKYVLALRHPVEDEKHILGLKPVINTNNVYVVALPPQNYARLGADNDGDQLNIYAVHTKGANLELKKISPLNRKAALDPAKPNSLRNSIDMDISLAIYELTKEPEYLEKV